ncbi:MAG: UDP-N-acetylglucosamine 2-epimerase, partial [Candidatus Acidiferrum sp.]
EEDAIEHLLKEGRPRESIYLVGNVMIDSLRHFLPIAQRSNIGDELGLKKGADWQCFGVLTLHRPSNVDSTEKLAELLGAIDSIAARVPVIFPVHPRTQQRLSQAGIKTHPNLKLIPPIGYLDFLCLLSKSTLVLTDSGGIQEETTALGVPCLTLRENTERPITISQGTNQLIGTDPPKIVAAADAILSGKGRPGRIPPLWDGHAAERIVEILLKNPPAGPRRKSTLPVT